jgi:hypothetical protein
MECFIAAEKIYSLDYNQWKDSAAALMNAVSITVLLLFFVYENKASM